MLGRDHKDTFVMIYMSGGARIIGTVSNRDIHKWEYGEQTTVRVQYPKLYVDVQTQQSRQDRTPTIRGVVQHMHAPNSKQEEMIVVPCAIEILDSVVGDENTFACMKAHDLWSMYSSVVDNMLADQSGLVAPTQKDISNVIRLKD